MLVDALFSALATETNVLPTPCSSSKLVIPGAKAKSCPKPAPPPRGTDAKVAGRASLHEFILAFYYQCVFA